MKLDPEITLNVLSETLEKLRGLLERSDLPRTESFAELDGALQVAWIAPADLLLRSPQRAFPESGRSRRVAGVYRAGSTR
jgi:hypothetical protein